MLNILVPMAAPPEPFADSTFPKPLYEIAGTPMIQYVVSYLKKISGPKRFIFIVNQSDVTRFHIDNILKHLVGGEVVILKHSRPTKGAACTCLLAIDFIQNEDPLLISNSDQFIDYDLNEMLSALRQQGADGGVLTFPSVHPKWSYVCVDEKGNVVEAAEKNPISKNAIAGLYYFRRGAFFVEAAKKSIFRGASVNDLFYVAPVLNEMILENRNIRRHEISKEKHHSFYSIEKIEAFEAKAKQGNVVDLSKLDVI